MPFVPAPNVVQTNIRYTLFGQLVENTMYWLTGGPNTPSLVTNVAAALLVEWDANVMPLLSSDISLREVYAFDLTSESGPSATATPGAGPIPGGISNAGLPGNVAACISFRTNLRGRSFRGRIFLPGLYETAVVGNTIDTTVYTGLVNAVATVAQNMADGSGIHVVVSRVADNAPRATAAITTVTDYIATDPFVDSQRRRLTGRGL